MKIPSKERQKIISVGIVTIGVIVAILIGTHSKSPSATTPSRDTLLAIKNSIPTEAGKNNFLKQSHNLTQKVDPELVDLDSQIITCDPSLGSTYGGSCTAATGETMADMQGKFLGGQCCSALMDTVEYHKNLEKLQAYKSMPDIPLDPLHTPVEMAKKWIDYNNTTTLTPEEQRVYDDAYAISMEKPCCCKCWHYYTNEGIAKKMIKGGTFDAQQIAAYWDASDICGA